MGLVAPQAMRTVWLALLCLIGLATTLIVRMAVSSADLSKAVPSTKAEVTRGAALTDAVARLSEDLTARTKLQNSPSIKLDTLEAPKQTAPDVKPVETVATGLPTAEPKQLSKATERIVTRHWHDPFDKRRAGAEPTPKRKMSQRARSADASIAPGTKTPSPLR